MKKGGFLRHILNSLDAGEILVSQDTWNKNEVIKQLIYLGFTVLEVNTTDIREETGVSK